MEYSYFVLYDVRYFQHQRHFKETESTVLKLNTEITDKDSFDILLSSIKPNFENRRHTIILIKDIKLLKYKNNDKLKLS